MHIANKSKERKKPALTGDLLASENSKSIYIINLETDLN